MKTLETLEDCTPDSANANAGTLRGEQLLEHSLTHYGAARSIVVDKHGRVIGGNKTLQLAIEAGLGMRVVQTDGTTLVVVVRTDLDLATDPQARVLAYLDNRAAELGLAWNPEQLAADFAAGLQLGSMFTDHERERVLKALEADTTPEPLTVTVAFPAARHAAWQAQVVAMPGATWGEQLDAWLAVQMATLETTEAG
jgi:hypothetical protein